MSTGHCCTHAPQVVQDHSTSGSITPGTPSATWIGPTSGRRLGADSLRQALPGRFGGLQIRRLGVRVLTQVHDQQLGRERFSVCQAGHWDWQRPHSVQDVKSSRPFQVKSSILPVPRAVSSSRSSISVKSNGCCSTMIGGTAPRAGRPEASRLNQMFGQTVNRCQATPIVRFNPMVMNQAIEMMILMAETTIAVARISGAIPGGITNQENGKCARLASAASFPGGHPRAQQLILQTAKDDDADDDAEDGQLDVDALPGAGAEEPGLPEPVARRQPKIMIKKLIASSPAQDDRLAGPLVDDPVADQRQGEPRVEELPVRGDER